MNKRAVWVAKVQEFDLTIKPTSLMRGWGLCKLMAKSKDTSFERLGETLTIFLVSLTDPWFSNIVYFLAYGECPPNMNHKER